MTTKLTRKEIMHRYYEKHHEKCIERMHMYRQEHREELRAHAREYYQKMKMKRLMELLGEKANEADR